MQPSSALLVVPLGVDEADLLTLAEWDLLRSRARVFFEEEDHPLLERLAGEEIEVAFLSGGSLESAPLAAGDELESSLSGGRLADAAVVAAPDSELIARLAEGGAVVTSGLAPAPDPMTAARGAYLGRRASASLGALALIMARLRGPGGCPWDAEQTHRSLQIHLQEETHEVLEAIDAGNLGTELEEELGDLLLQVVFHAQMAADDGRFDLAGVADSIVAKLIRRHPHVFGDVEVSGAGEVVRNWESIKATEKERTSTFDGIPAGLPALLQAYKMQKRAAGLGFESSGPDAIERARAEMSGAPDETSLGSALFWLVAVARAEGIDPESALRRAAHRILRE